MERVRIIGIFAHVDAGKTTTSEAFLYFTGRIHRAGEIDEGDTQLDWMEQERERGITITAAATAFRWRRHRVNLIDTPGHIDFTAEVVRSMRVIDGGLVLLCGVGGVEPQTETVWMHANRDNLPRLLFINKLDRIGSDFDRVLGEVHERLTTKAVPIQLPVGKESDFRGVVDLLEEQALIWHDDDQEPTVEPIPASLEEQAASARATLVEAICETDDALLETWMEGMVPDVATLKRALRRAVIDSELVPVLCGASREHIAVQPLLDAVVDYLPAPIDLKPILGTVPGSGEEIIERPDDPDAPFCAAAFKIVTDPHVGHLTWVRVFSGQMGVGDTVYNPRTEEMERVGRIYYLHGDKREQVERMEASDVVALVGPRSAVTGDTLCDPDQPIVLETFEFPDPVIKVALKPESNEQREKLREAVRRLSDEDPTLEHGYDPETSEETLAGMGELHLDIAVDRLQREFGLSPTISPPEVAYRETIRRSFETITTYKKQTGGHGHFAEVELRVEPLERGAGVEFENEASAADVPRDFVNPVERGVRDALEKGIIAGYPVTDVKVTLLDGKYHEVDSAAMDFEIAGSIAVQRAIRQAAPALLEPVMEIDVNVSEEQVGSVVADVGRRRGSVSAMRVRGEMRNIDGEVPLAEARGYATDLRSLTKGRGTFTLEFDHYDVVPDDIAEEIIERRKEEGKLRQR
jgi:elongation factor G